MHASKKNLTSYQFRAIPLKIYYFHKACYVFKHSGKISRVTVHGTHECISQQIFANGNSAKRCIFPLVFENLEQNREQARLQWTLKWLILTYFDPFEEHIKPTLNKDNNSPLSWNLGAKNYQHQKECTAMATYICRVFPIRDLPCTIRASWLCLVCEATSVATTSRMILWNNILWFSRKARIY